MQIHVVGPHTARSESLQRSAFAAGCDLRLAPDAERMVFVPGELSSGVVLVADIETNEQLAQAVEQTSRIRAATRYLNTPIVVALAVDAGDGTDPASLSDGSGFPELRARLQAAGASEVFGAETEPAAVLARLKELSDCEPVLEELRRALLGPFTSATRVTMLEMAGLDLTVKSVYQKQDYRMFGDISAVIGMLAKGEGAMVLSFPEQTAQAVVRRVLQAVTDAPPPDLVRDCIGELANVIIGQARGILAGSDFEFTMATPTIVSGTGHEIRHKPGLPCLVITFSCELGDFALQLCMAF